MLTTRPYHPPSDEAAVYTLWQDTLGLSWPIPLSVFRFITVDNPAYRAGDHLVALNDNKLIGFIAYQIHPYIENEPPGGSILVALVSPDYQRRGIGRRLHDQALALLKERGVEDVHIASGALFSFWAGVPLNLPAAWLFFQHCGWIEYERTFDLICNLDGYSTPSWVVERAQQAHITINVATPADAAAILAFQSQHFPYWHAYYQQVVNSRLHDIVIAKDDRGNTVGTSYLRLPPSSGGSQDLPWTTKLGENTGGVGPLGVAETSRDQGVGLALAAKVTELLKLRGIAKSYVGYTWLVDWYGRLGYSIWAEYRLSKRDI